MNGKNSKLLRQGAKKYNLSYKKLKHAFKGLNSPQKDLFLKAAKEEVLS